MRAGDRLKLISIIITRSSMSVFSISQVCVRHGRGGQGQGAPAGVSGHFHGGCTRGQDRDRALQRHLPQDVPELPKAVHWRERHRNDGRGAALQGAGDGEARALCSRSQVDRCLADRPRADRVPSPARTSRAADSTGSSEGSCAKAVTSLRPRNVWEWAVNPSTASHSRSPSRSDLRWPCGPSCSLLRSR